MQESGKNPPPAHDVIAARAYQIWEQNGRPAGREVEFWLQAEQSLLPSLKPQPQAAAPVATALPGAPPPQARPSAVRPPRTRPKKTASDRPKTSLTP
jgi:hypothetical protein